MISALQEKFSPGWISASKTVFNESEKTFTFKSVLFTKVTLSSSVGFDGDGVFWFCSVFLLLSLSETELSDEVSQAIKEIRDRNKKTFNSCI